MDMKSLEIQIEEEVLEFVLQPRFEEEIQKAREYFYKEQNDIVANAKIYVDFNSWLIYDYILKNGRTIFEEYFEIYQNRWTKEKRAFAVEKCSSFLSIYELKEIHFVQALLQDIFTKDRIRIGISEIRTMEIGDLILTRCIYLNRQDQLIDVKRIIPKFFKSAVERSIISKYEEYKNKEPYGNWKHFLKQNSLLLLNHVEIITNLVEEETEEDEQYDVWQSVYFVKDTQQIQKILLERSGFKLDFEENKVFYFKWYEQDYLLAEIVLKPELLEVECISEEDRKKAKKSIEWLLGSLVRHYKDEVIGFYDII